MSLCSSPRLAPRSWLPSVLTLAACAGGLAACSGGHQKVASSTGYYPAPAASYEPSHAVAENVAPAPERPGLGTAWGEAVTAPISFAPFQRASAAPWAEVLLHYNDAAGLRDHAQYLGAQPRPLEVSAGDGALSVALVDELGRTLPGFTAGGRTLVLGEDGARYRIVVHNESAARFEIVASVDGLDVMDGQPADPNRRGYLVDPHASLTIDGFRTSDAEVAAFRFGRVAESYAAQTSGDRNVGVVGLAIFAERGARWDRPRAARWDSGEAQLRDTADPFPQRNYAAPPR
jgi:hypothetical protein